MKIRKRKLELRAENIKGLVEQRNEKAKEMQDIVNAAKKELRALSEDENTKFEALDKEIQAIDVTIKAEERARGLEMLVGNDGNQDDKKTEQRAKDEAALLQFIGGEKRALDIANNGGIIPTTVADRIIELVKELSPIYQMATIYNVGGDLVFPVYDETTPIQAAYVDDLTELTEQTGKFTTVKLTNYIAGVLAKISESLMNRNDFDLVSFVVRKVAEAIAEFMEKECLVGTAGKMTGVLSSTNITTTASNAAITADELIDVQMSIPEQLQTNAVWIMHKNTLKVLRKLKNSQGDYLLNKDIASKFGWDLLGKPVYVSKNCPQIASNKEVIAYGDMSGLAVKLAKNIEIKVLLEKYATQHAIGVVGYIEADSKIVEPQKLAVLKMKV